MIVHRTTFGFYDLASDEAKIIQDCIRSSGNASKVYHRVNVNGDIITSKVFDDNTQSLIITPTTQNMRTRSHVQRKWVIGKHAIFKQGGSRAQRQIDFDALADEYNFERGSSP